MEFRVLGDFQVIDGGREVYVGTARKSRLLLAGMLSRPGRTCTMDWLIAALWGDTPPASARRNVQQYVYQLRLALGSDRLPSRPSGYAVEVGDELDAVRFRDLAAQGNEALARSEASTAAELLREALALWRGDAFAEFLDCEPIAAHADHLARQRLAAHDSLARAELALGRFERLAAELPELVRAHPYQESLRAKLMIALYHTGRRAEALDVFQEARDLLGTELGTDPGEELCRVHAAILRDELPRMPRVGGGVVPAELPADVVDFTGRKEEVKHLDELAGDGANALVLSAIAGTGGAGKTALAVHWAHRVAGRFPDGQLYVNLHGYDATQATRPVDALGRLLRSLGIPPDRIPAQESDAAAMYRSLLAGRRVLVILDNAGSAEQVRPLLPGGSGCLVVVTSRSLLGGLIARDGARRIILDVLPPPDAVALLTRIVGPERCGAEPGATMDLARACGYLPLALRVAAANLADRPRQRIADYLAALRGGNRLSALAVDDDEPSSVRTVFGLSYRALPPETQRGFRLLGLVPGPDFTAGAAAALTGLPTAETHRLLQVLARNSLAVEHEFGRYAFHDLVRDYARELANAGVAEPGAARERLLVWYRDMANTADRVLRPMERPSVAAASFYGEAFADPAAALAWLDAEAPNLTAAVHHFEASHPRHAWQIAAGIYSWNVRRNHQASVVAVYEAGARAAALAGDPDGEAMITGRLGVAHALAGNNSEAVMATERAYQLRFEHGDMHGAATALVNLAAILINAAEAGKAIDALHRAERLSRRLPDTHHLTTLIHGNLGEAYQLAGRLAEALPHLQACLRLAESANKNVQIAQSLSNLGNLYLQMGQLDRALEHLVRAESVADKAGDLATRHEAQERAGRVHLARGDVPAAKRHLRLALAGFEETGHRNAGAVRDLLATL